MRHIAKNVFDGIFEDYRGIWSGPNIPEYVGRRTAFLPGEGTTLSIEGVHFIVDDDYGHLPKLSKANAKTGFAYAFAGAYQIVQKIYRISEEFATKNDLMYLDRVCTTSGDFALPGSGILTKRAE